MSTPITKDDDRQFTDELRDDQDDERHEKNKIMVDQKWKKTLAKKAKDRKPYKSVMEYISEKITKTEFNKEFGVGSSERYCEQIIKDIDRYIKLWVTALKNEQTYFVVGYKRHKTGYEKKTNLVNLEIVVDPLDNPEPIEYPRQELLDDFNNWTPVRQFVWAIDSVPLIRSIWFAFKRAHGNPKRVFLDNGIYRYQSKKKQ